jgi:putative flavoprotein involved in K+ transport
MTPKSYVHPVIVLGAGPAGLSCCYELIRRGIEPLVLEKGVAGNSFAAFPRNIFFGPWLNNLLPGSAIDWAWLLKRSTQPAYTKYLQDYAHQNRLPVKTGVEVLRVDQEDGIFRLQTSAGEFQCHLLVNATGYFQAPFTPPYAGLESTQVPHIHVCQYREPADVEKLVGRRAGRVLVVGKRLSAGETFVELHNAGYQMSLSYRGKLRFGPSQWGEALFSPLQWIVERLAVALRLRRHSYPRMAGGESQRLIRQGQVNQYADIERFESDQVVFSDGRKERFDLVIFATGYRPAVSHLKNLLPSGTERPRIRNMESQDTPGLFFLGLDQQRTYRSRFLRGIVEDSRLLAELVARRCARVVIHRPQGVQELAAPQASLVTN